MFSADASYPTAVASYDDEGIAAAIRWCSERMESGDTLAVWTSLKSNLSNCDELAQLVHRHSDVVHVAGRGGVRLQAPGPILMAWPDMNDIGELVHRGRHQIRGLCVLTLDDDRIRPWVTQMQPDILGDDSACATDIAALDPVVIEALKSLTLRINHNNTISAGWEKDQVVGTLLGLHDARIPMSGEAMHGWALANGWTGKNPQRLANFVAEINDGKRPRCRRVLSSDQVQALRSKAHGEDEDDVERR